MSLVKRITEKFKDKKKKRLVENYLALSILQGANYLLPLIALPYLVRVLGVEMYGLVMFASAFIKYFMLLSDYGFNLSATKAIAVNRKNIKKVAEIFWSVIIIKTLIMVLGFGLLTFLVFSFDKFSDNWLLYFLGYGMVFGQVYFPIWFFQGMEKMKYITVMNIIAKLIFVVLIFIVVREKADYIWVLLLNSLGFTVAGIISLWVVLTHFKIPFYLPRAKIIYGYFKDSTQFFLSQVSILIYTTSNTFALGIFVSNEAVAFYAAAEQLYKAMQGIFTPIVDALYPYISIERNIKLFRKIFSIALGGALIISIVTILFSNQITQLIFGNGFEETAVLLKLFALLIIIVAASLMLGYPFLAALGYPKFTNMSVLTGSILHLALLSMIIPIIGIYLVVMITIVSESFVLLMKIYGIRKYKLWGI